MMIFTKPLIKIWILSKLKDSQECMLPEHKHSLRISGHTFTDECLQVTRKLPVFRIAWHTKKFLSNTFESSDMWLFCHRSFYEKIGTQKIFQKRDRYEIVLDKVARDLSAIKVCSSERKMMKNLEIFIAGNSWLIESITMF